MTTRKSARPPSPGGLFGGGPQRTATYTGRIFDGYRWYARQHETPPSPFGYGLPRTSFRYSHLTWRPASDGGVPLRQLQHWDITSGSWVTVTGQRPLHIGSNERSTELVTSISR